MIIKFTPLYLQEDSMTKTKNSKKTKTPSKNADLFTNRDRLKTPKIIALKGIMNKDGSFQLLENTMLRRINQHTNEWLPLDPKTLATALQKVTFTY